jgi:hypothetical protein
VRRKTPVPGLVSSVCRIEISECSVTPALCARRMATPRGPGDCECASLHCMCWQGDCHCIRLRPGDRLRRGRLYDLDNRTANEEERKRPNEPWAEPETLLLLGLHSDNEGRSLASPTVKQPTQHASCKKGPSDLRPTFFSDTCPRFVIFFAKAWLFFRNSAGVPLFLSLPLCAGAALPGRAATIAVPSVAAVLESA